LLALRENHGIPAIIEESKLCVSTLVQSNCCCQLKATGTTKLKLFLHILYCYLTLLFCNFLHKGFFMRIRTMYLLSIALAAGSVILLQAAAGSSQTVANSQATGTRVIVVSRALPIARDVNFPHVDLTRLNFDRIAMLRLAGDKDVIVPSGKAVVAPR
jgi:hypothetical protein